MRLPLVAGRLGATTPRIEVRAMRHYTLAPRHGRPVTPNPSMITLSALAPYAHYTLPEAVIPELPAYYRGKVRDNYDLPTARASSSPPTASAPSTAILAAIPLKGQVLTQTARFWFERTADICPNHVLDYPDPNVVVCKRLDILPVEIVVRDYLAGTTGTSILSLYKQGKREMYGHRFPRACATTRSCRTTIITPTTKAFDGGHDEPLTPDEIVEQRLLTAAQWETVSGYALALFARGQKMAARARPDPGRHQIRVRHRRRRQHRAGRRDPHAGFSSRYWFAGSYLQRFAAGEPPESFDKDFVRTGWRRAATPIGIPSRKSRRRSSAGRRHLYRCL